jgi:hypothetical protein
MMTVAQLIKKLQKADPKAIVILQGDFEGNYFHEADNGVDTVSVWDSKNREVGFKKLTPAMKKKGYTEEDVAKGKSCVVLWPK